ITTGYPAPRSRAVRSLRAARGPHNVVIGSLGRRATYPREVWIMQARTRLRLIGSIFIVAIVIAAAMPSASAAFPGANGKLAFQVGDGIRTMWANGTGSTVAVRNAFRPAWSPDGDRIAFQRQAPDGYYHIWVKDMETGTQWQVTSNPRNDTEP